MPLDRTNSALVAKFWNYFDRISADAYPFDHCQQGRSGCGDVNQNGNNNNATRDAGTEPDGGPQTGIIPAHRRIDWTPAGVPGGIPDRTTVCETIDAATWDRIRKSRKG